MGSVLAQVALYGLVAAAAAPIAAVVSALILGRSKRPQASAWTLTAGAAFLAGVFAVVVLASGVFEGGGDAGAILDVGLGVVFAVFGFIAIVTTESPEKDEVTRTRADRVATRRLRNVFAAGMFVQIVNFDALAVFGGALKEVAAADISGVEMTVAVLFGLALMLSVYYGPAIVCALSPARAEILLVGMVEWIMRNRRMLAVVTGLCFGVLFLWKGLVAFF